MARHSFPLWLELTDVLATRVSAHILPPRSYKASWNSSVKHWWLTSSNSSSCHRWCVAYWLVWQRPSVHPLQSLRCGWPCVRECFESCRRGLCVNSGTV